MLAMTHKAYFSLTARIVIAIALFIGGLIVGQYSDAFLPGAPMTYREMTDQGDAYKFVDPLLFCADREVTGATAAFTQKMRTEIGKVIDESKASGAVTDASVYYRDLNNGPWADINREMRSAPASLLKVPLAISIYQKAEKEAGFLDKKVMMKDQDFNGTEHFKAPRSAQPGQEYTVKELIDLSTVDSDNNATVMLIEQMSDMELRDAYEDLGIDVPIDNPNDYTMTVGTYSSFFRILFNASYLSRDDSEYFLSRLAESTFTQGIVAGIPRSVPVAHKFGENSLPDGRAQLHDCGIVYRPGSPYLLCIMTQGTDHDKLASVIAKISETVWQMDK